MDFGKMNIGRSAKRTAFLGLMSCLSIVLGYLESLLPPIAFMPPGARLGLGNVLIMYTGLMTGVSGVLPVVCVKAIFVFLTRGLTAGLMSLAGGLLSGAVTAMLLRRNVFGCIGTGAVGGVLHNIGQLTVAMLLTSPMTLTYLPMLILFGTASGSITGTALYYIVSTIDKLRIKHIK